MYDYVKVARLAWLSNVKNDSGFILLRKVHFVFEVRTKRKKSKGPFLSSHDTTPAIPHYLIPQCQPFRTSPFLCHLHRFSLIKHVTESEQEKGSEHERGCGTRQ